MKKNLLIILGISSLIIITTFLLILKPKPLQISGVNSNRQSSNVITFSPTPSAQPYPSGYKATWIIVRDLDKLFLYPNFTEELTSSSLAQNKNCSQLVSGGFFTEDRKPIGLFVSEGQKLGEVQESTLFNGFFSISEDKVIISIKPPRGNVRIALQSGPILILDGKPQNLSLSKDENTRRIVVATDLEGNTVFLALYDKKNMLSGPKLSELPDLLNEIQENVKLKLKDVINLDGGSHSAFISDVLKITEVSTIGSFFCINP